MFGMTSSESGGATMGFFVISLLIGGGGLTFGTRFLELQTYIPDVIQQSLKGSEV